MHTEGDNTGNGGLGDPRPAAENEHVNTERPGYETTDANVGGVIVFLGGLFGSLIVFFFVCYGIGGAINSLWLKQDGPANKWTVAAGTAPPSGKGGNLVSNAAIEQQELQRVVGNFSQPRLESDDGEQDTADLHAREDLLLKHYSLVDGQPGTIRIPIERAMELIAQRGLPVAPPSGMAADPVAYAALPPIQVPLTDGFARTGYEQEQIEGREQKMAYGRAEAASVK